MKVGGNKKAKEFLETQSDWDQTASFQERYNSRAAALLRDKVTTEARGESWDLTSSSARDYIPHNASSSSLRAVQGSANNLRSQGSSSQADLEDFYGMSRYTSISLLTSLSLSPTSVCLCYTCICVYMDSLQRRDKQKEGGFL